VNGQTALVGSAYDSRRGEEWFSGQLTVDGYTLHFFSEAANLEIPLVRLQIEVDKTDGTQVFFRDQNVPEVCISTYDAAILGHRALRGQAHTRNQIEALQSFRELKQRLKITGAFIVGFALLAVAVSLLLGFMVRSLAARIPPEFEQEFGDSVLAEFKEEETFLQDAKLQEKLEHAAAPLIAALPKSPLQYKFYVVDDPLPNAFALPGGHVVATTRLLELSDRPEEIAGVVAHEIAHVRLKHSFRQTISSVGPYLLFRLFVEGGGGVVGVLGGSSQLLIHQGFSQDYELEADSAAWDYLVAARIDPRALASMLKKLDEEQRIFDKLPGLKEPSAFSSHPTTEKRIRRLEAKWRKLKDKSAFENTGKSG
jgi:beta-barrel assembly-enhancing protease